MADNSDSPNTVHHVTINMSLTPGQFPLRKITTSATTFYWAISALLSNQLTRLIRDPREDLYQTIKDCLISLYNL